MKISNLQLYIFLVAVFICSAFTSFCQSKTDRSLKSLNEFDQLSVPLFSGEKEIDIQTISTLDSLSNYINTKTRNCQQSNVAALRARLHFNQGLLDSATYYFIRASKFNEVSCSNLGQYFLYNSWGLLKQQMDEYAESDSLYDIALTASSALENKKFRLYVIINKSVLLSEQSEFQAAIELLKTSIEEAKSNNLINNQLIALQNLGAIYFDAKQSESAIAIYNQIQTLLKEHSDVNVEMDTYHNLALIYEEQSNFEMAAHYYQKAIELAETHDELNSLSLFVLHFAQFQNDRENYSESYEYLTKYMKLKERILNREKLEMIKGLEKQYETAKQRQKILEQKLEIERKTRNRNTLLFVLIGITLLTIGVISRLNYVRKSKRIVEREKKRSDDLLLNILPHEVAEELKEKGSSEARYFDNVGVLFSDFKDFTQVASSLNATELVEQINTFFKSFDQIMADHQIEKIKTIGDAYMAASGIPTPQEKSALNLVKAGIAMMKVAQKNNENYRALNKAPLEMRIGIHIGPIVAGIVGLKKFQYDIWGDTVNTASRMESASEPGRINISKAVFEIIKDEPDLIFESRGSIEVKGKGQMEMYYVDYK